MMLLFVYLQLVRKYYLSVSGADSARYPMGFLHIMLPYKDVDVNLDPNKTHVLLQEKVYCIVSWLLLLQQNYK